MRSRHFKRFACLLAAALSVTVASGQDAGRGAREVLADLIVAPSADTDPLVEELSAYGDPVIRVVYEAWRTGDVYAPPDAAPGEVLLKTAGGWETIATGEPATVDAAAEEALEKQRPNRSLRRDLRSLIDTLGLKDPDPAKRIDSARKLGLSQDVEFLPALEQRLEVEEDRLVRAAIAEALAVSRLANGDDEQIAAAVVFLGEIKSVGGRDFIEDVLEAEIEAERPDSALAASSQAALKKIENHLGMLEFFGSFFRGLSTGSVLLIVSFGLAITFGLMGIINMAHGEFVAIGGYATYMVHELFRKSFGIDSDLFGWYFIIAIPVSFGVAAVIGLFLEKTVIRFLYRRPLESLLCTWGLSMVMQQVFRLIFGAANVQVNTPEWLLGDATLGGFTMSFTRLFILLIALMVCIFTWALLRKTNLGLHIRAVMQNRNMASSLGIPVNRVNSMTFALGCGLAAVGGSVLSQIGNVGPSMGQAYIVDSFMVVVIGSIGNLLGAGLSSLGIGMVDQVLQPSLGPVMGKITVFAAIILFLQWRPGGIFPTRSRSLDD